MQAQSAFVKQGNEIPAHIAFKAELKANRTGLSPGMRSIRSRNDFERLKTYSVDLLKEIGVAEADRKRWTQQKAKRRIRRLAGLARRLEAALTEVIQSPTLYGMVARALSDAQFHGMRERLRNFATSIEARLAGPSQSQIHVDFRRCALCTMVGIMRAVTKTPNWEFLSELIYIASERTFEISPATPQVGISFCINELGRTRWGLGQESDQNSTRLIMRFLSKMGHV